MTPAATARPCVAFCLLCAAACSPSGGGGADASADGGPDADADADADSDSDADADSDSDADGGSGPDAGADTLPDGGPLGDVAQQEAFVARYEGDGAFSWVVHTQSYGEETAAIAAVESSGRILVAGRFTEHMFLGPGGSSPLLHTEACPGLFLAALSAGGAVEWARADGAGAIYAAGAAPWCGGGVAVAGSYEGAAALGLGDPGEAALPGGEGREGFVALYDDDGGLIRAGAAVGAGVQRFLSAAVGPGCEVYGAGSTGGTAAVFGAGGSSAGVSPESADAALLCAWGAAGGVEWCRATGGTGLAVFLDLAPWPGGGVIGAGRFTGAVVFGEGGPEEAALDAGEEIWAFVARYSADGALLGIATAPSDCAVAAALTNEINVAPFAGGFYLSGRLDGEQVFDPGGENETSLACGDSADLPVSSRGDLFLARYADDGSLEWAVRGGGTQYETGHAVAALAGGSAAIVGAFSGYSVFGEPPGEVALSTSGSGWDVDALVAGYSADGALAFARAVHGIGGAERGVDAVALEDGALVAVGLLNRPAVFGSGEPTETVVGLEP